MDVFNFVIINESLTKTRHTEMSRQPYYICILIGYFCWVWCCAKVRNSIDTSGILMKNLKFLKMRPVGVLYWGLMLRIGPNWYFLGPLEEPVCEKNWSSNKGGGMHGTDMLAWSIHSLLHFHWPGAHWLAPLAFLLGCRLACILTHLGMYLPNGCWQVLRSPLLFIEGIAMTQWTRKL